MNCKQSEKLILLKDSGELNGSDLLSLDGHLNVCSTCREFDSALSHLRLVVQREHDMPNGPSSSVLEAIQVAAGNKASRVHWTETPFWKVAMAVAAGLAVCLTGIRFLAPTQLIQQSPTEENSIATEIVPLVALVMGGNDSSLDNYSGESDLSILADQLLILQGMKVDAREDAMIESTSPEDNFPTTLLWNSNSESHPERCV